MKSTKLFKAGSYIFSNYRIWIVLLISNLASLISYFVALCLRFEFDFQQILPVHRLFLPACLLLICRQAAYIRWNLSASPWRYFSSFDLITLFKVHLVSSLLFASAILMLRIPEFPRSVLVTEFAFSLLIAGGVRFLVRLGREKYINRDSLFDKSSDRDVVILGAGDSGHLLVKTLLTHNIRYHPVAVLDDNQRLHGSTVHGVKVIGGLSKFRDLIEQHQSISAVIVAIPSLSAQRFEQIKFECQSLGVVLKRLQSFEDIACLDANQDKVASIESLLDKEVKIEHEAEIKAAIANKRILITGAGGSIGSEIVRQVLTFNPEKIILFDSCEYNIFKIERELVQLAKNAVQIRAILGNICDEKRLFHVFSNEKPDIVFHTAAYKHVPLIEDNAHEAFSNNIVGTRNLLEVAFQSRVQSFVLISTDKAVGPSSIMGCSKRIAEMLVQFYNKKGMPTAVVRFGNVINSNGSVIPTFREQIQSGGPITVTHPDIERYFMSIQEAVRLVLTAGTLARRGEIYVLDMGNKLKIVDVARKMLALYGRRDIPIVFTGLRPGEKLTEYLIDSGETSLPTHLSKISMIQSQQVDISKVQDWIESNLKIIYSYSNAELCKEIHDFINQITNVKQEKTKLKVA